VRRREFIALAGGVAAWPLAARAAVSDAGDRLSQRRVAGAVSTSRLRSARVLKMPAMSRTTMSQPNTARPRRYSLRRVSLDFSECDIEIAENGMSDDEEESVRQEALADEQFLLVELPAAIRKIRAKAKGNERLARKLVFGKLKYTGPEASFSSSHASVMKALDECFHVIVGKAADEIDKTRELLKELKREVMLR
jgi:hypothetical protein